MRKILLLCFSCLITFHAWSQTTRVVTGLVTSSVDNTALPGVSVVIKGTTIGTVTDSNGKFTIEAPTGSSTIIFSFIGLQSKEVEIGNLDQINVSMNEDVTQLGEVVVTGMGMERSEKTLGYAVTKVGSNEITKGRAASTMNSLQGKVAGVQISTASGAPGASTKVIIRGYSSLGGNNNPLYVIDGVPINNGANNFFDPANSLNRTQDFGNRANDINPDDVESISILKGAAATSLYGSRASAGVIMITTKKGKAGDGLRVDFTSSATFTTPLRLPQRQTVFGQGWSGHFAFEENGSWGPKMDGQDRLWGNVVDDSQQIKPFKVQEDNLKDFYDVGTSFINTVSLSGGSDKATYMLSYSNVNEDGVVPTDNDSYKRNTLSFRGTTVGKKLSTSYSVNYVNKNSKTITTGQGQGGATMFQEIIQIPVDMSIVDFKDYHNKFNNLNNYFTQFAQNPYWSINENGNDFEENRFYGNAMVDYEFTDWLKASLRVGGDVANSQLLDWVAIAKTDPGSPNGTTAPFPGKVDERRRFARELYGDFIISANKELSSSLSLQALAGYSVQERRNKDLSTYVIGLSIPNFYHISNSFTPPQSTTLETARRLLGVYGQVTLGYNEYLFLTVQARNDWSSTLPIGNNSFFYPSANLSFLFSDAFKLSGPISSGKARISYGRTGNDATPYSVYSTMTTGQASMNFGDINFPIAGVNAFEVSNQVGNGSLKPEISSELEVGAAMQFFNNRVGFDVAYYDKQTVNQIFAVPFATTTGFTTKVLNFGKIQNKGIELLVNVVPVKTNNLTWDLSVNYTQNRNKVLELVDGLDRVTITGAYGIEFVAEAGSPLGAIYGPDALRDSDGNIVVNQSNGIPVANPELVKYGNAQAKFIIGINNQVSYKNLSLSFGFDIRQGGLIYSYTKQLNYFVGNATQTLYNDRQPFIVPNSVYQPIDPGTGRAQVDDDGNPVYRENTTPVSVGNVNAYWNTNTNKERVRDLMIDRSYVKLREVVLSYTVPKAILSRTPFKSLNVAFVGRNLLLWTPTDNNIIDPEVTTFGNDLAGDFGEFAAGPSVRSLGFSLKGSF